MVLTMRNHACMGGGYSRRSQHGRRGGVVYAGSSRQEARHVALGLFKNMVSFSRWQSLCFCYWDEGGLGEVS